MEDKIIFNGRVYSNEIDMPPDVKIRYEKVKKFFLDADQDGTPDFIQQGGLRGIKDLIHFAKDLSVLNTQNGTFYPDQLVAIQISDSKIIINGRKFKNAEEMPPDIRETYERIVSNVDLGEFEIYDEPWRLIKRDKLFEPDDNEMIRQVSQQSIASNPFEEVNSKIFLVIFIIIAVAILVSIILFRITHAIK